MTISVQSALQKKKILFVGQTDADRALLTSILEADYIVSGSKDVSEAFSILRDNGATVSAILFNVLISETDISEFLQQLQNDSTVNPVAVMGWISSDREGDALKAIDAGVIDVVCKQDSPSLIQLRIKNAIQKQEAEQQLEQLRYLADYDSLTNLYSRTAFIQKTEELIREHPPNSFAIAFIDINHFKTINDLYGHTGGNKLLCQLADNMQEAFQDIGICSRISADVFAAVISNKQELINNLFGLLSPESGKIKLPYNASLSIGLYIVGDSELSAEVLLDRAALAHSSIKEERVVAIGYYTEDLHQKAVKEQEILNSMHSALINSEFKIYFQPVFDSDIERPVSAEVLVRWVHPQRGKISPSDFIPLFEQNGFINHLDEYVWNKTCYAIRQWTLAGLNPLPVSINLSRMDLLNPKFIPMIVNLLDLYKIKSEQIRIEITESVYVKNTDKILLAVYTLQRLGFLVAMDDFGSAYSSLNSLADMPVDILKLDMKFIASKDTTGRKETIIEHIVKMALSMGLKIIAEGVEKKEEVDFLRSIGCKNIQGYYYSKPLPTEEFEALCKRFYEVEEELESPTGLEELTD